MGVNFTPLITPLNLMKIQIENHNGRLRLRWDDGDKRQTLAIGVNDSPLGRSLAQKKKQEIEHDWLIGQYDRTLLKYRPRTIGKTASEILAPELFRLFGEHQAKYKCVSRSSIESRYKPIVRMLEKHLNKPAHTIGKYQVDNFVAICQETISGRTGKERCWLIQSAWEWARDKYHLSPDNPWLGAAGRFEILCRQQVKPFTIAELQAIRAEIANHPHYCHYSDFVSFLTNTGVRFGEAAGLRWKHLGAEYTTAWIGESISRGHHNLKTKTGKDRTIQISPALQAALVLRYQRLQPKPDDLVFPAPKGGAIDDNRFRARCWKTILATCNIEYRKPYAIRHSAISHALANGANPIALAEQTGHDKRVLLDTYAHAIAKENLFIEV
jgi:integrase